MFNFQEIIVRRAGNLQSCRFLRHDDLGARLWWRDPDAFAYYACFQSPQTNPYQRCEWACHFIKLPGRSNGNLLALFVGATRVRFIGRYDGSQDVGFQPVPGDYVPEQGHLTYRLDWIEELQDLAGRVSVEWRQNGLPWSLDAEEARQIFEMRASIAAPTFPGFSNFLCATNDLPSLPAGWVGALASERGVYLLACTRTGEQYVGSALGQNGFWGRLSEYGNNGHGGNLLLRNRAPATYLVSILEVASATMTSNEIVAREAFWKAKLGSQVHGLNAN